jgi:ribosomal protein S6--L-glutamate ligase
MRIGVLSKNQAFWATTEIIGALKDQHAEPIYLHTPQVHLSLDGKKADAVYDGRSLASLDAAIPRIGRSLTQLGTMILKQFELMRIPSTLSVQGLLVARNKYLTLQALHSAGLRIPESVLIASRKGDQEPTEYLSPPLVMKLLAGTQGIGVMLVTDPKEAGPIIDTLSELDQIICIQKYLPNPGEDIRVFVTGNEIVGAMRRKAADHEWRSNIHIGGHGIAYTLSAAEAEMAIKAAQAVGVEIAGVDLITVENEPYVIEVNASPGFKGLLNATGINAAQKIAEYAVSKAKK